MGGILAKGITLAPDLAGRVALRVAAELVSRDQGHTELLWCLESGEQSYLLLQQCCCLRCKCVQITSRTGVLWGFLQKLRHWGEGKGCSRGISSEITGLISGLGLAEGPSVTEPQGLCVKFQTQAPGDRMQNSSRLVLVMTSPIL